MARMPERLDEEELADWRAGRNAVYQLAALTVGARLAVADAVAGNDAALEVRERQQAEIDFPHGRFLDDVVHCWSSPTPRDLFLCPRGLHNVG